MERNTSTKRDEPSHDIPPSKLTRFALARITSITLTALLCAGLLIAVANDLYAFVKPDRVIALELTEPLPLEELTARLHESGAVNNPTVFGWYVRSKGRAEELESFSGQITLNSAMSYREILLAFSAARDAGDAGDARTRQRKPS